MSFPKLLVFLKMRCFIALFVYSLDAVFGVNINYCGARMCGNANTHTFCQYKNGPGPLCNGYMNAQLTNSEKSRILARLNRRRNETAAGLLRGMPPAGNMMKLRWLEELAKEAQLWADQCAPPDTPETHDTCRNFYSISVGQCVASVVGEAPGLRVESMVDMWYMQNMLYKGNVTVYLPPEQGRSYYGDFAQMVWFRSFLVGCGRSRFMFLSFGRLRSVERLVCNFAPHGPRPYRMMWSPTIPGTACPYRSQPDRNLAALCDFQYDLKVSADNNNSMAIEDNILLDAVLEGERNKETDEEGTLDKMFLTKLAVVTMEYPTTMPHLISLQKRDILENIDSESGDRIGYQRIYEPFVKNILKKTNKKKTKTKVVGRPRPYNIDELNENGDDHTEENLEEQIKREAFYRDYIDGQEDNKYMIPEAVVYSRKNVTENTSHENGTVVFDISETVNVAGDITRIATDSGIINSLDGGIATNTDVVTVNETQIVSKDTIDDYLSDPETVKQLQEALDKAERNAAPSETHGKVRRDLTNYQPPLQPSPVGETNRTSERGPMLKMVLKYMPYLKDYENELLGSPAGNRSLRLVASYTSIVVNAIGFSMVKFFILF